MEKIDAQLEYQLHNWRTKGQVDQTARSAEDRVEILVRFTGDLESIERAGFTVESVIGNIALGSANLVDIERIAVLDQVLKIESSKQRHPQLNVSVPEIHGDLVRAAPLSLDGTGIIVGIIDTGIDIFHQSFRNPDGSTRILSIWDQTLTAQAGESPPGGFTTGVEFSAAQIANALAHPDQDFRHQDSVGHGTHVAGTSAGDGSQAGDCHSANTFIGVAPKADIIVVKTTFQTTGTLNGAKYIFQRAAALNKPVVVNMSLGGQIGAHDGTDPEESGLDMLVGGPGQVIVVSAGNDADKGLHAFKNLAGNASITLSFIVANNDRGDQFDLWYSGASRLAFTLTPPTGPAYQTVNPGDPGRNLTGGPAGGDVVWAVSRLNDHPDPSDPTINKHEINFRISPAAAGGKITSGTWKMTLRETANAATNFDVWIAWKNPYPHPDDPEYIERTASFDKPDQDATRTITIPGTAHNVITIGAYDPRESTLGTFSSRGPTAEATGRRKPDICAPGVGITAPANKQRSHWYICDCCLDFYVPKQGTSMAAPHVTGVAALMLERNRNLTFSQVRDYIKASGRAPDPITGPTLPNNDWGTGKVDAQVACTSVPPAGGGGGGGGAGGAYFRPHVPDVAMASEYAGIPSRLRALEQRFGKHPLWQLLAALVSTHFDEVSRLINTNRRVGTTWRRLHGPLLMQEALRKVDDLDAPLIPIVVADRPLHGFIERWLAILARYSSARLQVDIERYRTLILAMPGASLRDLEAMEVC